MSLKAPVQKNKTQTQHVHSHDVGRHKAGMDYTGRTINSFWLDVTAEKHLIQRGKAQVSLQVWTQTGKSLIKTHKIQFPLPSSSLSRHQKTGLRLRRYWGWRGGACLMWNVTPLVFLVELTHYDLRPHNYPRWPGIQWFISLGSCEGSFG